MYCSKVCCGVASKEAIEVRQLLPDCKVYIFYIDMRTNQKDYEEAERLLHQAIAMSPDYPAPHYNLRRIYMETKQWERADEQLAPFHELRLLLVGHGCRFFADGSSRCTRGGVS